MKYSFPSMPRLLDFMQVRGGDFSVLTGPDDLFFATLACGETASSRATPTSFPNISSPFTTPFRPETSLGRANCREQVNRIIKVLSGPGNMSRYKEGRAPRRNPDGGHARPLLPISAEDRRELIAYLESVDYTHPENYVG